MISKSLNLVLPHVFGALLVALEFDKPYNPVTVSLFCPIRIVMVSQNLADLVHELQFRIWFEFGLIFHDIRVIYRKFSIYQHC
jgi:hypothetical protein